VEEAGSWQLAAVQGQGATSAALGGAGRRWTIHPDAISPARADVVTAALAR